MQKFKDHKDSLRVLFHLYIPDIPRAAGVQQSIRVCYYLAKAGASVYMHVCTWAFKDREELLSFFGLEDQENLHVKFYLHPFKKSKNNKLIRAWGNIFHLMRILKLLLTSERKIYNIFLVKGLRIPALHIYFKSFFKYKIVLEAHEISYLNRGDFQISGSKIYDIKKRFDFEKYSYCHADGVVTISRTLNNIFKKKWGTIPNITVIPSGTILFESSPLPSTKTLKKIFFIGNYYPLSGLDFAVRALIYVPEATLTIVGGGGEKDLDFQRVKALVGALDLRDRVEFKGFILPRYLPETYAEADILIMPYTNHTRAKYFSSPLKLFEYMSARRPIIASDLPTVREILKDGENGVLARAEDSKGLARAILKVMNDQALASKISERAYRDVKKYSMEAKCAAMNSFFQDVLR